MFRSAQKITIQHEKIYSDKGIIFAPVINLNGLIVRSDKAIPEAYKAFFTSHHIDIKIVRYKGDLFVKMTGTYDLDKQDIINFIKEYSSVITDYVADLDEECINSGLFVEIREKIQAAFDGRNMQGLYEGRLMRMTGGGAILGGTGVELTVEEANRNSGRIMSGADLSAAALRHEHVGQRVPEISFGLLAEVASLRVSRHMGNMLATNALIEAGGSLLFGRRQQGDAEGSAAGREENSVIRLKMDNDVYCGNSPYAEQEVVAPAGLGLRP